jgi:hypothetical protein
MSVFDALAIPDCTRHYYLLIQGIPEAWVDQHWTGSAYSGRTERKVLAGESIRLSYGAIDPYEGLGRAGSLRLDLVENGGYLWGLTQPGTETTLAADMDTTQTTCKVTDASALGSAGGVHIHREYITYTSKSGNTLQNCTRNNYDTYGDAREHTIPRLPGGQTAAQVRVGTTPGLLEGRWCSLRMICLDQGGYPISFGVGEEAEAVWEIWRGVITAFPPSVDGIQYRLEAETIDRRILSDPPSCGLSGRLLTGAYVGSGAAPQQMNVRDVPVWVPPEATEITVRMTKGSSWDPADIDEQATNTVTLTAGWRTVGQILDELVGLTWYIAYKNLDWAQADPQNGGTGSATVLRLRVWPEEDLVSDYMTLSIEGRVWQQLGFAAHTVYRLQSNWDNFDMVAQRAPAHIDIRPTDTQIPVLVESLGYAESGFVKLADEAIFYGECGDDGTLDGVAVHRMASCIRGVGGTQAGAYRYAYGDGGELPEISPCYVMGGVDGSSDPSPWHSAMRALCGHTMTLPAGGHPADDSTGPSLGIDLDHFDHTALYPLTRAIPVVPAVNGIVDDIRSAISGMLALEGYALVAALTERGCLLTPVRVGAPTSADLEVAPSLVLPLGGQVALSGGLGEIVTVVRITGNDDSEALYRDADAIQRYGIQQTLEYQVPLHDRASLLACIAGATRLLTLGTLTGAYRLTAECSLEGRSMTPGAYIVGPDLSPRISPLSGTWQVLECSQPLRGSGHTRIVAARWPTPESVWWAPTSIIEEIDGTAIRITTGEGDLFDPSRYVTLEIYVYDSDDMASAVTRTVSARTADWLTLDSSTGLVVGRYIEIKGAPDDRYFAIGYSTWSD